MNINCMSLYRQTHGYSYRCRYTQFIFILWDKNPSFKHVFLLFSFYIFNFNSHFHKRMCEKETYSPLYIQSFPTQRSYLNNLLLLPKIYLNESFGSKQKANAAVLLYLSLTVLLRYLSLFFSVLYYSPRPLSSFLSIIPASLSLKMLPKYLDYFSSSNEPKCLQAKRLGIQSHKEGLI